MLIEKIGYSYNDVTIIPSEISDVSSRSECNPFVNETENYLPIFASPMASVVNEDNLNSFIENGIIPIVPRNINLERRKYQMGEQQWVALSLKEFQFYFVEEAKNRIGDFRTHYFICVDIANGHMKKLYNVCIEAKKLAELYDYKLTIMTGNIANAKTYKWICQVTYKTKEDKYKCAIDYIRVGIGGGSGCITTSNVSIHYPQATLIDECYKIKTELKNEKINKKYEILTGIITVNKYDYELPKIVADGGIRNYDHVIKALALGADYVMIGSIFSQCIESAGVKVQKDATRKLPYLKYPLYRYKNFRIDQNGYTHGYYTDDFINENIEPWKTEYESFEDKFTTEAKISGMKYEEKLNSLKEEKCIGKLEVKFFGMASADGQKSINGTKTKTAEGITKYLPVKYTLKSWTENMISYLRSAMSYTNCFTLKEFIGKPYLIVNSISEIQAVNK